MDITQIISRIAIALPGFLLAIVFHEAAHAYMANKFGDPTAKNMGRLSLNPAVHYDPFGTVLLPLLMAVIGSGIFFGYARPVPVDARYFKNIKRGIFWVSFAGPLANIFLAILSALLFSIFVNYVDPTFSYLEIILRMLEHSLILNVVLAVFNLIPFPPLDGSKMVATFLDYNTARQFESLERYTFLFFIVLMISNIFSYIVTPFIVMAMGLKGFFIMALS